MIRALVLLLSVAACGHSEGQERELQRCGGVQAGPQSSRACPSPTVERDGSCTLVAGELGGECASGYHVEMTAVAADLAEPVCVVDAALAPSGTVHVNDVNRAAAKELFRRAHAEFEAGAYEPAAAQLQQAIVLYPHPTLWAELAQCEERLGRLTRALSAWRACLVVEPPSGARNPERAQSALLKLREQAASRIADLDARLARLRVEFPSDLEQPRVALNRALYPSSVLAAGVALDPGEHEIVVTARGRNPWVARVRIASGEDIRVKPELSANE